MKGTCHPKHSENTRIRSQTGTNTEVCYKSTSSESTEPHLQLTSIVQLKASESLQHKMQLSRNKEVAVIVLALICTLSAVCIHAAPLKSNTQVDASEYIQKISKHHLFEDGLFEGDLKIPMEVMYKHYNFSSIPGGEDLLEDYEGSASGAHDDLTPHNRDKRAAGSDIKLWENHKVQYEISSGISMDTANLIRRAMDHWEENTCLRFVVVEHDYVETTDFGGIITVDLADYIEFVNTDSGCYSTSVGKAGRKQTINLEADGCEDFGIIVHQIGHAVGFWHEQSRPDRDCYITVNSDNIEDGEEHQFMRRNDHEIDYLYDYVPITHSDSYITDYLDNTEDYLDNAENYLDYGEEPQCNDREIDYQGLRYDYGSIMHYGNTDFSKDGCVGHECITLVVNNNAEYTRQGSPTLGQKNGLSARDIQQSKNLYFCEGDGVQGFLMYRVIRGVSLPDTDPVLNDTDRYVKFTSVDSAGSKHYNQTSVKGGTTSPEWNEWLFVKELEWQFFRIRVWDDGDDAMSISQTIVPEIGDHTNIKHCVDTSCSGYVTFDYKLFTLVTAKLSIKVRSAHNLEGTDPTFNDPDPYVRIEAMQSTGAVETRSTGAVETRTSQNLTWNQWINYGCQRWALFHIQVWDDNNDEMSNKETTYVQLGLHESVRHEAHGDGYLLYDYNLVVDGNQCNPNPCLNRGYCDDGCSSYTCNCRYGYSGTNCEHLRGELWFYARYGRDLPDEDPIWNSSDPYMEFIAIDENGNSVRMTTSSVDGDESPRWFERVDFGTRAWKEFKVRVYDDDDNADDPLSDQQTWTLSRHTIQHIVRLDCHRGYVIFDYWFRRN